MTLFRAKGFAGRRRIRKTEIGFFSGFNSSTLQLFSVCASALLLTACAGSRHFHVVAEGPTSNMPQYVELETGAQVATLHFPPGAYSFYAADDAGYYYSAPRKIVQHRGEGSVLRDGGIYVNKRNPKRLRGYVYIAGALTHVGNLSSTKHEFRDSAFP